MGAAVVRKAHEKIAAIEMGSLESILTELLMKAALKL